MTTIDAGTTRTVRPTWPALVGLHLAPAAIALGAALLLAPVMRDLHLPAGFALTVAFAVVLIPVEVGVLLYAGRRATGDWSARSIGAVVSYRQRLGRWWWSVPPLFLVALLAAVWWQPFGAAAGRSLAGVLPDWLLPDVENLPTVSRTAVIVTLLVALVVDGIAVPLVEELYFRGFLLPRLPVRALLAVPLSAGLFAVQHYWQPYNWVLIFLLQLILTALVVRSRSLRLGIVMHMLVNVFGVVLALLNA